MKCSRCFQQWSLKQHTRNTGRKRWENVSLHSKWRGVFPTCYLYPRVRSLFTTYLLSLLKSFFFFCKYETSLTAEDGGIFLLYELRSAWKETCYSCRSFFAPPSPTSLQNCFDVSTSLFPSLCFKLAPPSSSILRRKSEGEERYSTWL